MTRPLSDYVAIDCEMVITTKQGYASDNIALARVAVVDHEGKTVYDRSYTFIRIAWRIIVRDPRGLKRRTWLTVGPVPVLQVILESGTLCTNRDHER
jgi:hypothetical protein